MFARHFHSSNLWSWIINDIDELTILLIQKLSLLSCDQNFLFFFPRICEYELEIVEYIAIIRQTSEGYKWPKTNNKKKFQ